MIGFFAWAAGRVFALGMAWLFIVAALNVSHDFLVAAGIILPAIYAIRLTILIPHMKQKAQREQKRQELLQRQYEQTTRNVEAPPPPPPGRTSKKLKG